MTELPPALRLLRPPSQAEPAAREVLQQLAKWLAEHYPDRFTLSAGRLSTASGEAWDLGTCPNPLLVASLLVQVGRVCLPVCVCMPVCVCLRECVCLLLSAHVGHSSTRGGSLLVHVGGCEHAMRVFTVQGLPYSSGGSNTRPAPAAPVG